MYSFASVIIGAIGAVVITYVLLKYGKNNLNTLAHGTVVNYGKVTSGFGSNPNVG